VVSDGLRRRNQSNQGNGYNRPGLFGSVVLGASTSGSDVLSCPRPSWTPRRRGHTWGCLRGVVMSDFHMPDSWYEPRDVVECECENDPCTCEQDALDAADDAAIERADSIRKGEW